MSKSHSPLFRSVTPNPAGGEWPELSQDHRSANIDVMHDELKRIFNRVLVPFSLANTQGDTKEAAEILATLFLGFLQNFLADNVADGVKKDEARIAQATIDVMNFASSQMRIITMLSNMGMPAPVISAMLHSLKKENSDLDVSDVKVFTVKPGEDLPDELTQFLRGH
jgi:hypothetical protein